MPIECGKLRTCKFSQFSDSGEIVIGNCQSEGFLSLPFLGTFAVKTDKLRIPQIHSPREPLFAPRLLYLCCHVGPSVLESINLSILASFSPSMYESVNISVSLGLCNRSRLEII